MNPPSPVEWRIRAMTMDDVDQVVAIDEASFPAPWPARSYRFELQENPVATLFVAEVVQGEAEVIAYIGLWELADGGHISTLAVAPEYRRQGIARSMLIKALKFFASKGVKKVGLDVRRSNEAAQKLYERFGFEVIDVRQGYYHDNDEDALVMQLDPIPTSVQGLEVNRGTASNS